MTEVRRATKRDRSAAADTLGAAFVTDPIMSHMLRDGDNRQRLLRNYFHAELSGDLRHDDHLVFVAADAACVAIWRGVDRWKTRFPDTLRLVWPGLRAFGPSPGLSLLRKIEAVHPSEAHYYLDSIATLPTRQGEGLGARLVTVMTDRADAEGLPCYLESSNPVNEPFYRRHGFQVRDELDLGRDVPVMRTMWREPQTPGQE